MPLSPGVIKKLRALQALANGEGYELFCFAFTDAEEGELATFNPRDMSREQLADVAMAVAHCLMDGNTTDVSGTCVPPSIN